MTVSVLVTQVPDKSCTARIAMALQQHLRNKTLICPHLHQLAEMRETQWQPIVTLTKIRLCNNMNVLVHHAFKLDRNVQHWMTALPLWVTADPAGRIHGCSSIADHC